MTDHFIQKIAPRNRAEVPEVEYNWSNRSFTVLRDNSLGILQEKHGGKNAECEMRSASGGNSVLRVNSYNGEYSSCSAAFSVQDIPQFFDNFADGGCIIAHSRCRSANENNAYLIDEIGNITSELFLADGIGHLQVDPNGNIWTGYFDEGVFSSMGWGTRLIGSPGINRFDRDGNVLWSYFGDIADCYALNVANDCVWACTYPTWQIIKIEYDGSTMVWDGNVKCGAPIIFARHPYVVLLGGYGGSYPERGESRHGVLLELGSRLVQRGEFELDFAIDDLRKLPLAMGRGSSAHFVHGTNWYELTVDDVVRTLT